MLLSDTFETIQQHLNGKKLLDNSPFKCKHKNFGWLVGYIVRIIHSPSFTVNTKL